MSAMTFSFLAWICVGVEPIEHTQIMGVPIALIGIVGYTLIMIFAYLLDTSGGYLFYLIYVTLVLFAATFTATFLYPKYTEYGLECQFCIYIWVINMLLLADLVLRWRPTPKKKRPKS